MDTLVWKASSELAIQDLVVANTNDLYITITFYCNK